MPNLRNVMDDVHEQMFQRNSAIKFEVKYVSGDRWLVYVKLPYAQESAKLEFLIGGDDDVSGSVLRYGSICQRLISRIMDSVIERF